ncbi:hypothetical protein F4801DRAFT_556841 [Xylaria longipes]|nr:hypothetical protein F4801DRAFT_556841 [Xylaria longipes]
MRTHSRRRARKRFRKGSEPITREQKFFPDDIAQLLAWLDHCIENGVDFESSVVNHLKKTRNYLYTIQQIKAKLRSLWGKKGYYRPGCSSADIFREGTVCLELLDNAMRTRVNLIKATLDPESETESSGHLDGAGRRASSPLSSVGTTPPIPSPLRELAVPAEYRRQDSSREDTEQPQPPLSDEEDSKESKRRVLGAMSPNKAGHQPGRDGSTSSSYADIRDETYNVPAGVTVEGTAVLRNGRFDKNQVLEILQIEVTEKDMKIAQQRAALMSRDNRIFQLESQLSSILKEFEEMKKCLRLPKISDPASHIKQLQYSVSCLKQQLSGISAFQNDSRDLVTSSLGPVFSDIRKEMDALEGDILDVCASLPNMDHLYAKNWWEITQQDPGLELLCRRSMGSSAFNLCRSMSKDSTGQLHLLRSLVAASVSMLAFESPFLEFLSGESVLLDKYRDCLLLRDGPHGLKTVDVLAHKALVSEPYFESAIIQTKSKESAVRLAKMIGLLLTADHNPCGETIMENGSSDSSAGAEYSVFSAATDLFQDVFASALRLRARLLITGKRYQAIFARPGQEFDASTMNKDGWNYNGYNPRRKSRTKVNAKHSNSSNTTRSDDGVQGEIVKMCLFPAIYEYSAKPTHDLGLMLEAKSLVVDYNNFTTPDELSLEDLSTAVVSKAVVLT